MNEKKAALLKEINTIDKQMLEFNKRKPEIHPERLSVNELKKLKEAFETIDTLFRKSVNLPDPDRKVRFMVGDLVIPKNGCNKGIPCKVIDYYFPDEWNKIRHPNKPCEQYITVIPLRSTDILKGHTASRLKQNKYTASNKVFKSVIQYKDNKTGRIRPELFDWVDGELKPLLDEHGHQLMDERRING